MGWSASEGSLARAGPRGRARGGLPGCLCAARIELLKSISGLSPPESRFDRGEGRNGIVRGEGAPLKETLVSLSQPSVVSDDLPKTAATCSPSVWVGERTSEGAAPHVFMGHKA